MGKIFMKDEKNNNTNTRNEEMKQYAQHLLSKLTLEEKIGMIHGAQLFQTAGVKRLGIPPLKMSDGPMGVRQEFFRQNGKLLEIRMIL